MSSIPQFRYISTETETAYIDSRVYCAEIIEVDHSDWMRDTLKKHQSTIESKFGSIRFETGAVLNKNGVANNTQNYVLLTEPQCNACLVLSKNQTKTIAAKMQLVEDFEKAKKVQKTLLERQLTASLNPTPPRAIVANPDNTKYNITFWKVHADSGIVDPWHVRDVIVQNYDFKMVNGYVCVTQKCTNNCF